MISSAKALKIIGLIILLSVSFWFIFILFLAIKAPVSWGDEALHGEIIKRLFSNQPVYPPFDITLFGRHLPLTTDMKHGVVEIYLLAPFMYLGGMTIEALRSGYIFWVVITLLITYYFCFSFFSFAVANLALILLAVNFPYFDYSRLGTTFGITLPFFVISSLIFSFKWEQRRNNLYLYLAFFFLALGFQVKGWFIYFILALFICSLFFRSSWQKVSLRIKITAAFVFSAVLLPFIFFYFKSSLTNFVVLNVAKTSTGKINNFNIFGNLLTRLDHFAGIVSGSNDATLFLRIVPFLLFCLAFIFLIHLVLSKRLIIHSGKGVGFILLVFFFTFFLSVFTLTFLRQGHLIILFPLVQIILALAIVEAWKLSKNVFLKALVVLFTFFFIFFNLLFYRFFFLFSVLFVYIIFRNIINRQLQGF